jgi:hypothetical protein
VFSLFGAIVFHEIDQNKSSWAFSTASRGRKSAWGSCKNISRDVWEVRGRNSTLRYVGCYFKAMYCYIARTRFSCSGNAARSHELPKAFCSQCLATPEPSYGPSGIKPGRKARVIFEKSLIWANLDNK